MQDGIGIQIPFHVSKQVRLELITNSNMQNSKQTLTTMALSLGILFCVFFCFWQVRGFEFYNFDDNQYVSENSAVNQGLTEFGIKQAFRDTSTGHWHPLTWISHMTDCELFGLNAGAHHLMNAAIHALNATLVFLFIVALSGSWEAAALGAFIFGLHPMRIESVAWVSERKDVLSMFFGLITLIGYTQFAKNKGRTWYLISLLAYTLSLLSKPTFVTLPALLVLLDFWPLKRKLQSHLVEKIPFALAAITFAIIVTFAQRQGEGLRALSEVSFPDRITGALVSYLAYFGKFFIPTGVGIFYPATSFAPGIGAGAFAGFLALCWLFGSSRKSHPYLIMGWLWFVFSLLPMIGIVQIGGQIFADRWTYLPHLGLILAFVFGLKTTLAEKKSLRILASVAVVIACATLTTYYLPFWKSSQTVFAHTLEVSPHNFMAHTNLGSALDQDGKLDQAAFHYEEAARLNPTYPEALNNLGTLRARQGRFAEAEDLLARALNIRPNFSVARYNYGLVFNSRGDDVAAVSEWILVLHYTPGYQAARQSIETVLSRRLSLSCEQILAATPMDSKQKFISRLDQNARAVLGDAIWEGLTRVRHCYEAN